MPKRQGQKEIFEIWLFRFCFWSFIFMDDKTQVAKMRLSRGTKDVVDCKILN